MHPAFVVIVDCKPFVVGGCVSKFLSVCASEQDADNRRHKASNPPTHYRHARSVGEAAIAEAAAASSRMENIMVHVAAQIEAKTAQAVTAFAERVRESVVETEARTSHTVGSVVQQLEREIEAAMTGAAVTSEMKTKTIVEGLHYKIKAHLDQNRADFDRHPKETQDTIA